MEKIKIYALSDGTVYEAEARETKNMYVIDDVDHIDDYNSPFWLRSRLNKDEVYLTPIEAVEDKIKRKESSLELEKRRVHAINSELGQLKKLKNSLENHPYPGG